MCGSAFVNTTGNVITKLHRAMSQGELAESDRYDLLLCADSGKSLDKIIPDVMCIAFHQDDFDRAFWATFGPPLAVRVGWVKPAKFRCRPYLQKHQNGSRVSLTPFLVARRFSSPIPSSLSLASWDNGCLRYLRRNVR